MCQNGADTQQLHKFYSTLCLEKVSPLMFDNNFGRYGPILNIISTIDS